MCEFCHKHGEGKRWYLEMKNYSRELLAQGGRVGFIDDTRAHFEAKYSRLLTGLDAVRNIPVAYGFIRRMAERFQKNEHWGQIVPIEDIELIIDFQDSIVRLPCRCRTLTTGAREARYCFGLGVDQMNILGKYPDYSNVELVDKEEAKRLMRTFDREGLIHSIWTFKTPYIGGLCNCDHDCVAYRVQVKQNLMRTMFRAEYVAQVDRDLCTGCRACRMQCHFGAIRISYASGKAVIDTRQCYGCGVCRVACPADAITLERRADSPDLPW
ncbi:MAG: 4Fe-4S dicluster domain-containing protein [Deltaproteobacteria bacterium]|nr:4Fe-4S dicluster domain-containing protein [Deltaproteobacteria bacterium]